MTAGAVLSLVAAGERLALPAAEVAEILRVPPVTRVPNAAAALLGVANLRGTVLPVLSLAALLGHAAGPASGAARVVVLAGGAPVGLLVDAVAALGTDDDARRIEPRGLLPESLARMMRPAVGGRAAAGPVAVVEAAQDVRALLGLRVGGQEYAIGLDRVAEVMRPPATLAEVPRTDGAMLGAAAYRGGLLPLVSLGVLLGHSGAVVARGARVVVAELGGLRVGLVVDGVTGTLAVPATALDPVPPVLTRGAGEAALEGICRLEGGRRLVGLLSAARLFDAPTAARLRDGAQRETAMAEPAARVEDEQFVVFRLGSERYGLPIAAIDEVVRRPAALTRVPHAPDFVEGVMNLRGRAVPLIDAARRFGAGGGSGGRVLVVTVNAVQVGFAVDGASELLRLPAAAIQPAPEFQEAGVLFDRVGIAADGRMILLVSAQGLLEAAERDMVAALVPPAEAGP